MNDRPKMNTPAGEALQRATSGQNVPKSGVRENHYFGTGSCCLSADGKETGKLQDADRQKESGKGKPENRRPASGACPCGQRD